MSDSAAVYQAPSEPASQAAWLERVRSLPAPERIAAISAALGSLSAIPTTQNVFWRKTLLRLYDSSRLEARMVSPAELHRENSPFASLDFGKARIIHRPRARA